MYVCLCSGVDFDAAEIVTHEMNEIRKCYSKWEGGNGTELAPNDEESSRSKSVFIDLRLHVIYYPTVSHTRNAIAES